MIGTKAAKPSDLAKRERTAGTVDFNNDDDIVSYVEERWAARNRNRAQMDRQWFTNIANYMGYQYHTWDSRRGGLSLPKVPSWRVRLVCNRLLPIVQKVVSKFLRQKPSWIPLAATNDTDDIARAAVAKKFLQALWRKLEMNQKLVDALNWAATTGNVFMSCTWDPTVGEYMDFTDEEIMELGDPAMGGSPEYAEKALKIRDEGIQLGEIDIGVHSPFECDPNPGALNMKTATDLLHSTMLDLGYLEMRYGDVVKELSPDAVAGDGMGVFWEKRIRSLTGPSGFLTSATADSEPENMAMTHRLWVKPTRKYRLGYYCVVAGRKVLYKLDRLPDIREIPYVHLYQIPVPGRFWGTCSLEQCLHVQADYNRGRSQIIENRNLMSKPKWLVPNTADVTDNEITSEPGEKIEYTWPQKPEMTFPPPLPEYVMRSLDMNIRDMEDISGIHEVSSGRGPTNLKAGVAMSFLAEQDDQTMAPAFMVIEDRIAKLGSYALEIASEKYQEPRMLKVVGQDLLVDVQTFLGSDLVGANKGKPGVSYFDVVMQVGPAATSKSQRDQRMVDLVTAGIFDTRANPDDKKKVLKYLELETEEPILNDAALDRQRARLENEIMLQGMQVPINSWDDDPLHIEEHRRRQKSPNYPGDAHPNAVQIMDEHILWHEQRSMGVPVNPATGIPDPSLMPPPVEPGMEGDSGEFPMEEQIPQEEPAPEAAPIGP